MKASDRHNVVFKVRHMTRVEGMRGLVARVGSRLPLTLHSIIAYRFASMDDVLSWVKKHSHKYEVYSFDVFDTLLRRRIDPPQLIQRLVAEHMSSILTESGINVGPGQVLEERNAVVQVLRDQTVSRGKDPECHLNDIISGTLAVIEANAILGSERIVDYEIDLERKTADPMPGAEAVLTYLKSVGKRVICVSGTHLSSSQIAAILEHHGFLKYIDKLYISSDLGRSKATGKLFECVIENEGGRIVHIGDDYLLDNIIPKRFGVETLWLQNRNEHGRKSELRKLSNSDNKLNYVNAIIKSSNRDKSALFHIGYDVVGPALTIFVHCVAEQAMKDGIQGLFFTARDGYVMKKIYGILQSSIYADHGLPASTYMCLSTFPVRSAAVNRFTYAEVSEVYAKVTKSARQRVSLKDVLSSYGLEPSHFTNIVKEYKVDLDRLIISDPAHDSELNALLRGNEFQDMVRLKIDENKKLLRDYLVSIGFMGRHKVAVVDSDSKGITQSLLGQAFHDDKGYPMVLGYYFNLLNVDTVEKASIQLDLSHATGMVSDWRTSSSNQQRACVYLGLLIELFSHPYHGITVGYKKIDSKVMPVFRKTSQESQYQVTSQGLRGILSYAKDYGMYYSLHNYKCEELLENAKTNIMEWAVFPPKRDLQTLENLFLTFDWPLESKHFMWKKTKIMSATMTAKRLFKKIVPPPFVRMYFKL